MFLPRCDDLSCASITEQTTGKWNLFALYNKYMKKYISKDLLNFSGGIFGALKKVNRATSLARDIAVGSMIGLY